MMVPPRHCHTKQPMFRVVLGLLQKDPVPETLEVVCSKTEAF